MFFKPPNKQTNQKKGAKPQQPASTQEHLPVVEIKNSIAILKDGSLRIVLMVSTVNFDLKSEKEQNALIYAYMRFLNSLDFPIQISIQSRRLDLTDYIAKLGEQLKKTSNPLLQIQIQDYIKFINKLLQTANIMDKRFYVIVPYFPSALPEVKQNSLEKIRTALSGQQPTVSIQNFNDHARELLQRAQVVASGLGGLGLRAVQLSTQEIIELLYSTYNPGLAVREKLIPIEQISKQGGPQETYEMYQEGGK